MRSKLLFFVIICFSFLSQPSWASSLSDIINKVRTGNITSIVLPFKIKNEGAIELAAALLHNTTVTTIDLSFNQIENAGAIALAKALHHNTTVKTINLKRNQIGDAGIIALAEALLHNTTVTTINLECNQIGDAGVIALIEALHHNTTVTTIDLAMNQIRDAELFERLRILLERNRLLPVVSCQRTPTDTLMDLARRQDIDPMILSMIVRHPAATPEVLLEVERNRSTDETTRRIIIASRSATEPGTTEPQLIGSVVITVTPPSLPGTTNSLPPPANKGWYDTCSIS